MKNKRFILLLAFCCALAPVLSMGPAWCSMCEAVEAAMPACHAGEGASEQLTPACCCALISCADLQDEMPVSRLVEAPPSPALELAVAQVTREFVRPSRAAPRPVSLAKPNVLPLYQLKNSFLI